MCLGGWGMGADKIYFLIASIYGVVNFNLTLNLPTD